MSLEIKNASKLTIKHIIASVLGICVPPLLFAAVIAWIFNTSTFMMFLVFLLLELIIFRIIIDPEIETFTIFGSSSDNKNEK